MIKSYLKSAFRFLWRNKLFTGINIVGLSLALAASFIILLFVINELSYNKSYKNRRQIYRVLNTYLEFKMTQTGTPYVLASALKSDFPQVEYAVRARNMPGFRLKMQDDFVPVYRTIATDSEIFSIFDITLAGLKQNILDDPNSVVLSKSQAEKFFPDGDPVGKEITGLVNGKEQLFIVKGVFDDFPVNSTLRADCFINSRWTLNPGSPNDDVNWELDDWTTWVLLKKNVEPTVIVSQFRKLEVKNMGENPQNNYSLQNLDEVYLHSDNVVNSGIKGNMKNIRIFSSIALLIILVATFNYIILSTAVSSGRTKEIGIRKTSGAAVKSIRNQLLGESLFLALTVLPVALALAFIARPYAEKLFQTELYIIPSNIAIYTFFYLLLTVIIGVASGLYTSSYLSRLNVVHILKKGSVSGRRKSLLRSSLIVVQLVIFCSFISSTLIIRSQYKFALNKNPGFKNKDILFVDLGFGFKDYKAFINSINSLPDVKKVAGTMYGVPTSNSGSMMLPGFRDQTVKVKVEGYSVDYNFVETMGIQVLEGRSFSEDFKSDLHSAALVNETAVKELGIDDPIGKQVAGMTIIGIVKDFNLHSIHTDIPPLLITMTDKYIMQVAINYRHGSLGNLLPLIENEWKKIVPGQAFQYSTVEDILKKIYSSERNLSAIISISAMFSLLIAAFGLFGLTLFIAKTRTKEIGVKKVMGSSQKTIIYSFLKENIIMVVIAAIVAVPGTWHFMNNWLNNFSYKTTIDFWVFVFAFAVAIVVVCATVLYHSYRVARINPVEALRYE